VAKVGSTLKPGNDPWQVLGDDVGVDHAGVLGAPAGL